MGESQETLKVAYQSFIRSGLELSAPLWHFALTQSIRKKLEQCQKAAIAKFISEGRHYSYSPCLAVTSLTTLEQRRNKLSERMATDLSCDSIYNKVRPQYKK